VSAYPWVSGRTIRVKTSAGFAASRATGGAGAFASSARVDADSCVQNNKPGIRNQLFMMEIYQYAELW
jgi:hypothetical protein